MTKSKAYLKGFKHGVLWAMSMLRTYEYQIALDSKQAIKSLRKGR